MKETGEIEKIGKVEKMDDKQDENDREDILLRYWSIVDLDSSLEEIGNEQK